MEESRFEKQVKDKMDELSFLPSDTVWKNIKEGIKEKKRSRRGILFLFLILAAGSYVAWNAAQKQLSNKPKHVEKNLSGAIPSKNDLIQPSDSVSSKGNIYLKNKMQTNLIEVGVATMDKDKILSNQSLKKTKHIFTKNNYADRLKTFIEPSSPQKNEINESGLVRQTHQTSPLTKQQEIFLEENKNNTKTFTDSTLKNKEKKITANKTDTLLRKSIASKQKNTKSKWSIGFNITSGISSLNNSLLSTGSISAAYSGSLPAANGQGITTRVYNSSNRPGFGFIAGVFTEIKITNKITLSAGINYASFSIKNISPDSVLGYFSAKEINYFSYTQLPLLFKIKINKSNNVPLYFQGGITLSKLLKTDIATNKLYYHNIQAGINGAISVGLSSMQKHQLLIGPFYYYNPGKIAGEGLYNQKHISFVGLRAEFIL